MAFLQSNTNIITDTANNAALISNYSGYLNAGNKNYGSGGLLVFGNNSYGQLGQENYTHRSTPTVFSLVNQNNVNVRIFVSVDLSNDNTLNILFELIKNHKNLFSKKISSYR